MNDSRSALVTLGWRTDTAARLDRAIRDFQAAWNLGEPLTVNGDVGPLTEEAIAASLARKKAGKPDISEHFSVWEFTCACGGKWSDCRRMWAPRQLISLAEGYRTIIGPFTPARACRCPKQNAAVGGAKQSMHLHGLALDLPVFRVTPKQIRKLQLVSGIGYYTSSAGKVVRHADMRHLSSSNPGGGSVAQPATWAYGKWTKAVPAPHGPKAG